MNYNLLTDCERCGGSGVLVTNPTTNNDPRYDVDYPCDVCCTGKVTNKPIVEERIEEWQSTLESLQEKKKRLEDAIYNVEEHLSYLKYNF